MRKQDAANLLATINLGSGVAETDDLLESARVETSVFLDLLGDRVDLVPGTKGSGKTALYRMIVDFLPELLLRQRRVVIAHGIRQRQDSIFLAYKEQFDSLSDADFVDFWCVYLVSLAYEQFVRSSHYQRFLTCCEAEVDVFRRDYHRADLPQLDRPLTLKEIIAWALAAVKRFKPKVTWKAPAGIGQLELSLGSDTATATRKDKRHDPFMTTHIEVLVASLEKLLARADLSLWLMIDRLDELFARRSDTETRALRSLLRTLRLFRSDRIRVKVFLRDDIFDEIVFADGFTALSHLVARKSDTLRWSEEEILTMVVRRIFAGEMMQRVFHANRDRLSSNIEYQRDLFYRIFPKTVHRPPNQSTTLRWIYNHTKDGRNVVTPRDVILLLTRAFQYQRDVFLRDPDGDTEQMVSGTAISYGLGELSKEKRTTYLQAEFPHKWPMIKK